MFLSRTPKDQPKQTVCPQGDQPLIEQLLKNRITLDELEQLRENVTADALSDIIQRIYDLNEKFILHLSMVDGILRKLNDLKNAQRNRRFKKKINREFRQLNDKNRKVILAEGDSWFNYPVILTDVIDRIAMDNDFAVYSLAAGGDWLLNMLSAREYVEELSVMRPDVFLISGGGNDLVGSGRLGAVVDAGGKSDEFTACAYAADILKKANQSAVLLDRKRFDNGARFLSKDFFALLMFFHLQYYFLISGIVKNSVKEGDKFFRIKVITQGYDYAIPSFKKRFGLNPLLWYVPFIRSFLGHGVWLKSPLLKRGIIDDQIQKDIVYAMIYLFNEMMIDTGRILNKTFIESVSHIDSRGSVGEDGWTDELHPKPAHFAKTGDAFIACIKNTISPTYDHVFVVNKISSRV